MFTQLAKASLGLQIGAQQQIDLVRLVMRLLAAMWAGPSSRQIERPTLAEQPQLDNGRPLRHVSRFIPWRDDTCRPSPTSGHLAAYRSA